MARKRLLAVSCSHGLHIDPVARDAVLTMKREFKPHTVVHLGDFIDTTAFRSGAKGTADESEPVQPDIDCGLEFLDEIGANVILGGNHEQRLWALSKSPNALVSFAADQCIQAILDHCDKRKVHFVPWNGVFQGVEIGGYTFLHGSMYGENAIRDHAEMAGNCVHGHTHRPGIAMGRRTDNPIGFCLGTLTRRREMAYAAPRRATLAWGQAFLWGEYDDSGRTGAQFQLCLGPREQSDSSKWLLP